MNKEHNYAIKNRKASCFKHSCIDVDEGESVSCLDMIQLQKIDNI